MSGARPPARSRANLAWFALIAIVAVAGAGLVTSLDHARTEAGRPELTAHDHALVTSRLAALQPSLAGLATAVDATAGHGRDVLTSLRRLDPTATNAALDAGTAELAALASARGALTASRATLLDGTTTDGTPAGDLVRVAAIDSAITAAGAIPAEWTQVAASVDAPLALLALLDTHDQQVVAAAGSGRAERYPDALSSLGAAGMTLDRARAISAQAARRGLDTATLDSWMGHLAVYDAALSKLYAALESSGGALTTEVQADLAAVDTAQAALPGDRTGLVLIVTDLGGVPITDALLRIEAARGAVDSAAGTID
jgi:hypothetical protein